MNEQQVVRHAAAMLDAGRPEEALRLVGTHLVQQPEDATALRLASEAQRLLGRGPEALASAEQAARLEPTDAVSWRTLAFARYAVGDLKGAVESARYCVQLAPDDWSGHANLSLIAGAESSAGDLTVDAAREAVRLAPNVSQAHLTLGNALLGRGQPKPATESFMTALRLDPQSELARHNLAVASMRTGHHAAAVVDLAGLVAQAPTDERTLSNLRIAIGNTLGQIHTAVAVAAIVAIQVVRLVSSPGSSGTAEPLARFALVALGVVAVGLIAFLVLRTRRTLGSALLPVVRFVLARDRLIAGWAIVDTLALLPLLGGPLLPIGLWAVTYGFGWVFVFIGVILRVIRSRIMRNEAARRGG